MKPPGRGWPPPLPSSVAFGSSSGLAFFEVLRCLLEKRDREALLKLNSILALIVAAAASRG